MKASRNFYITYWLKNTIMAFGTGCVLGYFSLMIVPPFFGFFMNVMMGGFLTASFYQISVFNKFFGKKRGEFEYEFRVRAIDKNVSRLILRHQGIFNYIRYLSDGMNNTSIAQEDFCKKLLGDYRISKVTEKMYNINMKISFLGNQDDNLEKEISFLKSAIELKPNDIVANYRMAICLEFKHAAEDAIYHYQKALRDQTIKSKEIKDFIQYQIERIHTKGTKNKPPALGLRYS